MIHAPLKRTIVKTCILSAVVFNFSLFDFARADIFWQDSVVLDVPFTTQVPLGEWNDPRQRDGCEETSLVMAMMWVQGLRLTPEQIRLNIVGMSDYEQYFYGYFQDSSAEDTARLMRDYFNYPYVTVRHQVSVADIKEELASDHLALVPLNPRIISTTLFNSATINHMVVVVGYDDTTNEIIYHDPLHANGAFVRTAQSTFQKAMADYPSGKHIVSKDRSSAMIVVSKPPPAAAAY